MEGILIAGQKTIRWVGGANLLAVGLLATALACLVFGVQTSMEGLDGWRLFVVALIGMLFGWLLGRTGLKGWAASTLTLFAGGLLVALGIGRLAAPSGRLLLAVAGWYGRIANLERFSQKGFPLLADSNLIQAGSELVSAAQNSILRTSAWVQALVNSHPSYDPLAVMLVWSLAAWVIAAWSGWWLRRRRQPLVALAPGGVILALNLAFSGTAIYALVAWIGAAVSLQAVDSYLRCVEDWRSRSLDRADIEGGLGVAVGFLVLALMSMALFAPSLSIQKLASRIEQTVNPQSQTSKDLAQALGVRRQSRSGSGPQALAWNVGLPNQHLLGSGPELSEQVVLWVSLEGYQPLPGQFLASEPGLTPPGYYWRGAIYDRYTGRGWASVPIETETIPAGRTIATQQTTPPGAPFQPVRQRIQTASGEGGLVYVAGKLVRASTEIQAAWREPGDLFAAQVGTGTYSADSLFPQPTPEQLRQASQDYPEWIRRTYLAIPESVPRRVWELAQDLTFSLPTPYDQALAIETYLRHFPYTLDVSAPPPERDVVDYFLFDLQRGYCDYYASAMVILARAAGLPARLVTGYASGTYIPNEGRFRVTAADAHAWPEIYFPGYGWIEFEPTAGLPPIERTTDLEMQAAQTESRPLEPLRDVSPGLPIQQFLRGALIALGIGLALVVLWALSERVRLSWLPPSKAILAVYRQFYRQSRWFIPADVFTPHELASLLSEHLRRLVPTGARSSALQRVTERIRRLTEAYTREIYSPHPASEVEKEAAIGDWQKIRIDLWWARFRKMF
jgi:transglutaminase-like putative cysteine protease